jgi:hypothetical protein
MLLHVTEDLPVAGVIGLDQLETPLVIGDVPPDQGLLDVAGEPGAYPASRSMATASRRLRSAVPRRR